MNPRGQNLGVCIQAVIDPGSSDGGIALNAFRQYLIRIEMNAKIAVLLFLVAALDLYAAGWSQVVLPEYVINFSFKVVVRAKSIRVIIELHYADRSLTFKKRRSQLLA